MRFYVIQKISALLRLFISAISFFKELNDGKSATNSADQSGKCFCLLFMHPSEVLRSYFLFFYLKFIINLLFIGLVFAAALKKIFFSSCPVALRFFAEIKLILSRDKYGRFFIIFFFSIFLHFVFVFYLLINIYFLKVYVRFNYVAACLKIYFIDQLLYAALSIAFAEITLTNLPSLSAIAFMLGFNIFFSILFNVLLRFHSLFFIRNSTKISFAFFICQAKFCRSYHASIGTVFLSHTVL